MVKREKSKTLVLRVEIDFMNCCGGWIFREAVSQAKLIIRKKATPSIEGEVCGRGSALFQIQSSNVDSLSTHALFLG